MKKRAALSASSAGGKRAAPVSPEWLGLIASQAGEGVAVADLKGQLIFANRAWARMHGYTVRELVGKNLRIGHTARQMRDEVAPFNRKVMKLGKWAGEVGHVRKDGTEFATEMTTTVFHDSNKRPIGIIGFARDITERKRTSELLAESHRRLERTNRELVLAEDHLRRQFDVLQKKQTDLGESEERYRNLVEMSPYGIVVHSRGKIVYVNSAAIAMAGARNAGKMLGRSIMDFIHPKDRRRVSERVRMMLEDKVEAPIEELQFLTIGGSPRQVEIVASPLVYHHRPSIQVMIRDLSDAIRTAELLRESEEKYRSLVELSSDGILIHRQGRIEFINDAGARLVGAHYPGDLIGKNVFKFVHPDYRKDIIDRVARMIRDKTPAPPMREKFLRLDGSTVDVEVVASPIIFRGIPASHVIVRDITGRVAAEDSLRENEHKYRTLVETTATGYVILDCHGLVADANAEYVRLSGHDDLRQIIGRSVIEWTAPHDKQRNRAEVTKCAKTGSVRTLEIDYIHPDGAIVPIEINAITVDTAGGKRILTLCRETTERRTAEGKLQESERRFRSLVENMADGVYRSTANGKFLDVNPAMVRIFGYGSREELLQVDIQSDLYFSTGDRRRDYPEPGKDRTRSLRMKRKDGSEIWVEDSCRYIRDERGEVVIHEGVLHDITERKRAEEQLRQSEEFNRSIIENSPIGFAVRNKQGQLLMYNKAWVTIWAMTPERIARHTQKMVPATFRQVFDHLGWYLADVEKVFTSGGSLFIPELEIESPNPGGAKWVRQYFYTVQDLQGEVERIVALTDDITERKLAEERLRASEGRYQTLAKVSPVGIFRTDAAGATTYVNPRWCEISGLPQQDAMGDGWLVAVHPEDRERIKQGWGRAVSADDNSQTEYRFIRPDGSTAWVMGQAVPERNDQDRIVGYVGTITDITERRQTEEKLRESEANYRQIFDGIAEGIFRTTQDGRILMANPALIRMLGYNNLEELRHINVAREGYADATHRQQFQELMRKNGEVWGFQSQWRRKDGAIITISENARAVKSADGTTLWYEGTVEDITEHVRADMALLDEKDKLAQLFQVSLSVARAGSIQEQLDLTMRGLAELRLFSRMVIVLKDDQGRNQHVSQFGLSDQAVEQIRNAPPPTEEALRRIFDHKYRISNSYLIPHDDRDVGQFFSLQFESGSGSHGDWDPGDNLLVPLTIKGAITGYLSADEPVDGKIPSLETVRLLELYANQAAISLDNMRLYRDLEHSYYDTLKAFVAAMEAKDPYTKGHSENVQRYALKIARHLGLPEDRIRLIDFSSLLHDIGKMGVKEDILAKPAALSAREYEEVKQHPMIGSLMVSAIENLSVTGPIIRAHHESYDGSGYPSGIKGDQIPIESRIISVADAFEAMTSDRPYRKAFGYREALRRLEEASGTQFDREIVRAFIDMTIQEQDYDGRN